MLSFPDKDCPSVNKGLITGGIVSTAIQYFPKAPTFAVTYPFFHAPPAEESLPVFSFTTANNALSRKVTGRYLSEMPILMDLCRGTPLSPKQTAGEYPPFIIVLSYNIFSNTDSYNAFSGIVTEQAESIYRQPLNHHTGRPGVIKVSGTVSSGSPAAITNEIVDLFPLSSQTAKSIGSSPFMEAIDYIVINGKIIIRRNISPDDIVPRFIRMRIKGQCIYIFRFSE